jgi:putative peptidoglycan lipid II flippase
LLVFPNALLAVLFQRQAFDAAAVHQTAVALMGYGVGLMGLVGVKILAPGYYARQDIRTPVKIAIAVLVLTQGMNAIFVPFIGHAGLALSISLGAMVNATWLFIGLKRAGAYVPEPGWRGFSLRVFGATALLGGLLFWAERRIDWIGLVDHQAQRIGWLVLCLGSAALLYFGALLASGLKLQQFMRRG